MTPAVGGDSLSGSLKFQKRLDGELASLLDQQSIEGEEEKEKEK